MIMITSTVVVSCLSVAFLAGLVSLCQGDNSLCSSTQQVANIVLVGLAQIGILYALRRLYSLFIFPLYNAYVTRITDGTKFARRYGKWAILTGDIHAEITREYGKQLLGFGMNILIVENTTSVSEEGKMKDASYLKGHPNKAPNLLQELKMLALDGNVLSEESDHDNDGGTRVQYLPLSTSSAGSADEEGKKGHDRHSQEKDNMHSTSFDILKSRISHITTSGGLGIVVHITESDRTSPITWLSTVNTIMPYMLFRSTGAIIEVSIGKDDNDQNDMNIADYSDDIHKESKDTSWISFANGRGSASFTNQLSRSMHYEYSDKSIDCLSVSVPASSNVHVPADELVVRASWQALGNDSEVSLALCYFVGLLKYFFGDQTNDD